MLPLLLLLLVGCAKAPIQRGTASWYGPGFRGKPTASGERFRPGRRTAAHKTLPFGTVLAVKSVDTGKKVRVVINDRGPYAHGRVLDLSQKAAKRIGLIDAGHGPVEFRVVGCKKKYEKC